MRDKKKQKEWIKKNYKTIIGVRVTRSCHVLNDVGEMVVVVPENFFFHKHIREPFTEFSTGQKFHIPLSLTKRAKITVNKKHGGIVAKQSV